MKLNIPLYCCLNDRVSCTGRNLESKHKQNSSINSEECYIKLEQKHLLKKKKRCTLKKRKQGRCELTLSKTKKQQKQQN